MQTIEVYLTYGDPVILRCPYEVCACYDRHADLVSFEDRRQDAKQIIYAVFALKYFVGYKITQ